jgi:hypothetical protein
VIQQAPVPFWDSPAFTSAAVVLVGVIIAYLQNKTKAKVDDTASKVATIETHTNGMLTALQNKVDTQDLNAKHLAEITEKDRLLALKDNPPEPKK